MPDRQNMTFSAIFMLTAMLTSGGWAADTVNSQMTDSVTQTNTQVLGEAPAMATSEVYQTMADQPELENEAQNQQQMEEGSSLGSISETEDERAGATE